MLVSGASTSWCSLPHSRPNPFPFSAPISKTLLFRISIPTPSRQKECRLLLSPPRCRTAKHQQKQREPVKKRAERRNAPQEKPSGFGKQALVEVVPNPKQGAVQNRCPSSIPKPPAGFVVDASGRVHMDSLSRTVIVVDTENNLPLECVIRRVFRNSRGEECMLLFPVDTPVQILKSTNFDGWSAVNDEEMTAIIPAAAYALAKIHMHLVLSGFCHTARGGFCYSEEDILQLHTDGSEDTDGLPAEGIEITCFHQDGTHYMIYTPSDPLLFVAVKNQDGLQQIADDDLLEDPATISAIDEETEFNALLEEEATVLESLLGERD